MSIEGIFFLAIVVFPATMIAHAYLSRAGANRAEAVNQGINGPGSHGFKSYLRHRGQKENFRLGARGRIEDPKEPFCCAGPAKVKTSIDEEVMGSNGRRVKVTRLDDYIVSTYLLQSRPVFETLVLDENGRTVFCDQTPDRLEAIRWHDDQVLGIKSELFKRKMAENG
jgi:hypothetical protein